MGAKVLQMTTPRTTAETFVRTVGTIERSVNLTIQVIAIEGESCRLCQIELPNQESGVPNRLCIALLTPEDVDSLIGALSDWKELP